MWTVVAMVAMTRSYFCWTLYDPYAIIKQKKKHSFFLFFFLF
jgi:uncharacterized membrane protein YbhN (UPF0104 family)